METRVKILQSPDGQAVGKESMCKDKMISFRIPQDQYLRLREVCINIGARNISELARIAVDRVMESDGAEAVALHGQVMGLRSKLEDVAREVDRLARAVGSN